MSYCLFQNTLADLRDCEEALADGVKLSEDELRARQQLIKVCGEIYGEYKDQK